MQIPHLTRPESFSTSLRIADAWVSGRDTPSSTTSFLRGLLPASAIFPPTCITGTMETTQIDVPLDDRVLTALERNPHFSGRTLRFETESGRVTLRGTVRTYFQKQMAQEAVRTIDGVDEICNELEVASV